MKIYNSTHINYENGELTGINVSESATTIGQMSGFFHDEEARNCMAPDTRIYRVLTHSAVTEESTHGALYYGVSFLYPGMVGDEYFMTKGHFHQKAAAEYYWCIKGHGLLLLMDADQKYDVIEMSPGTLHYISEKYAHRVVNTGDDTLIFGACWPADAGHDYQSILNHGFPIRVFKHNGKPVVVSRR